MFIAAIMRYCRLIGLLKGLFGSREVRDLEAKGPS